MDDDPYNLLARQNGHEVKPPERDVTAHIERLECMILKYVSERDIRMASRGLQVEHNDLEMLRQIREKHGARND